MEGEKANERKQVVAFRDALHDHRIDQMDQRRNRVVLLFAQSRLQFNANHRNRRGIERFQAF